MIGITLVGGSGVKYITRNQIGIGGFGSVFRAEDQNGEEFALKLIAPAVDPTLIATFRQEIESASGLSHPNILRVSDWGSTTIMGQPGLFIVSELCKDGDYRSVVNSYAGKEFDLEAVLADFRQIFSGLEMLHSKIIHRDLKPENVLRAGTFLKIGDYGLAKFVDEATRTLTFKGGGTPRYMAPEVWLRRSATVATDLYAIGVMLFEVLTGRAPYTAADVYKMRDEHLYSPIPRPRSLNPDIPDYLDGIVKNLLAKEGKDRYQSASEVLDALAKVESRSTKEGVAVAAAHDIAARARVHHDRDEARSLEALKSLRAAEEEAKRNLLARRQLVSLFDDAVAEINALLPETKITAVGKSLSPGQAYQFRDRILAIHFFGLDEIVRQQRAGFVEILRAKNLVDGGLIKITANGQDREGWNVANLRPPDQTYDGWKLFKTRTLHSSHPRKIEPFATDATLFGENLAIHWRGALHIYQLSEKPLEVSDIYQIIDLLVPKI